MDNSAQRSPQYPHHRGAGGLCGGSSKCKLDSHDRAGRLFAPPRERPWSISKLGGDLFAARSVVVNEYRATAQVRVSCRQVEQVFVAWARLEVKLEIATAGVESSPTTAVVLQK